MKVNLGNIIPISTIDWSGRSSCVIFFNGCYFKCLYCQNYALLDSTRLIETENIKQQIIDAKPFISAVVISGGEPTMQFKALYEIAKFAKQQNLLVGIQTNGYCPDKLQMLSDHKLIDKLFVDIKADPLNNKKYSILTGDIENAAEKLIQTLNIANIVIEARTTIFKSINDSLEILKFLKTNKYSHTYVIQQGIHYKFLDDNINKKDMFSYKEMVSVAKDVCLQTESKSIKIRTKKSGEEIICVS